MIKSNFEDLTGKKFGKLTVLERTKNYVSSSGESRTAWKCQCECGNICVVLAKQLKNGMTKSCGCLKHNNKPIKNLIGLKFNRLTVIEYVSYSKYLCLCDCGNTIIVSSADLKSGHTKSCGCYKKESSQNNHLKKHGLSKERVYRIWKGMKSRCYNAQNIEFNIYGGRGIKICDEWKNNFVNFYNWSMSNGYLDNLTIDRIDVNGNYEPNNCRWISLNAQQRNRRAKRSITYNGITHCIIEWAEIYNINRKTLTTRLNAGWSIENALTTPVRKLTKHILEKVE